MKYRENESEPWKELYIKALDSMPIGMMVDFVGTDIPNGWLICDGRTLDEETYPELYDALGGSGGTFTLPDCKGRVVVGYDANDTDFNAIGKTGGSKELQSHSHELQTSAGANYAGMVSTAYSGDAGWAVTTDSGTKSGGNVLGGTTRTAGQGNSGNLQPYYVAYKIIKAKNTTPTMASIVNTQNDSTTDGYSCKFINKLHTYSTTEQVVGTWINGKPIYRKVVEKTVNATSNWTSYTLASLGISNYQYIYFGNGCRRIQGDRYVKDVNNGQNVYLDMNNGTVNIGPDSEYKNIYTLVFEYTKTTD